MGNVAKRPNGKWRARYRDADGKEHAQHFARKADADRWLTAQESAVLRGDHVSPNAGRVAFAEVAERWRALQVSRPRTLEIRDNTLKHQILPAFGNRQVGSIRKADIRRFVAELNGRYAAQTVRSIMTTLSLILDSAIEDQLIVKNPCDGVALPKLGREEVAPLTVEQVYALADTIEPRFAAAVVALAGSGLRIGELLGLDPHRVDFLRGTIRVDRQRLQSGSFGPPKTAASVRTVPVGRLVTDALAAHLAAYPSADILFTDDDGTPLLYRRWRSAWERACRAAGVQAGTHDLRHFYASALISGGASVKQVQRMLGHSSAAITLNIYAHLWPGDDDRARTVIDSALRRPATAPASDATAPAADSCGLFADREAL